MSDVLFSNRKSGRLRSYILHKLHEAVLLGVPGAVEGQSFRFPSNVQQHDHVCAEPPPIQPAVQIRKLTAFQRTSLQLVELTRPRPGPKPTPPTYLLYDPSMPIVMKAAKNLRTAMEKAKESHTTMDLFRVLTCLQPRHQFLVANNVPAAVIVKRVRFFLPSSSK